MLKSVLDITAYQMKSVINQDITKAVTEGIESLFNIPVKLFLDCLENLIEKEVERFALD